MDRVEKRAPWRDHDNWRDGGTRDCPGSARRAPAEFRHVQPLTPEQVVQRIASVSHVAVLPEAERDERARRGPRRAATTRRRTTRGTATALVELPYRVDCIAYGAGSG